jgi:hypothetical protein
MMAKMQVNAMENKPQAADLRAKLQELGEDGSEPCGLCTIIGAQMWTEVENAMAQAEGWAVFDLGTDRCTIQRLDEEAILASDEEAWRLVTHRADEGSILHRMALTCVSRAERKLIRESTGR